MKKFAWRKYRMIFLEAIFPCSRKLFPKFPHKIFVIKSRDIIRLENFVLFFTNLNPELRCAICTGVTLELHCSQPIRIENSFLYIINLEKLVSNSKKETILFSFMVNYYNQELHF